MGKKKKSNVVKYKKPFNIATLFFGAILVYMIIYLYMFLTSVHISGYEVIAGSLATDRQFTGLALRTEEIFYSPAPGYIDYYSAEGNKVSGGTIVYSIDESGRMSEYLEENIGEINLSASHYSVLKSDMSAFLEEYHAVDFSKAYHFHDKLNGNISELTNQILLAQMESVSDAEKLNFQRIYAAKSGIVSYSIDGFEAVTPDKIEPEMFDKTAYKSQNLRSRDLIDANDPVYKLVTDENWYLIVPMTDEQINEIAYKTVKDSEGNTGKELRSVLEIEFLKDHSTSWAYLDILSMHGQQYLQLRFNNSMVRFSGDRYLDIEFLIDDTSGLKIPSSAITKKEFFVIPESYKMTGGENNTEGFMVETFDANGESKKKFVSPTFYANVDGMIYIDPNQGSFTSNEPYMKPGDRILAPDSNDLYQVGKKAELEGVYCINQGYTQFRKIKVLYSNEEYSIVEEGTTFGITIYDRIVLNAETVKEEQVIY